MLSIIFCTAFNYLYKIKILISYIHACVLRTSKYSEIEPHFLDLHNSIIKVSLDVYQARTAFSYLMYHDQSESFGINL